MGGENGEEGRGGRVVRIKEEVTLEVVLKFLAPKV